MCLFSKKYEYKVYVEGMSCGHCSARVEEAFNAIKGIKAKVDLENKVANLVAKHVVTPEDAKKIVEDAGFTFAKFE